MNCATKTIKYVLFLFNICCAILGAILLIFGIWLLNNTDELALRIDHGENLAAILTIVLGSAVLIVSFFGCMGAFMEARGMLISYAVILVILLIVQLVLLSISYTTASADGVSAAMTSINDGFDHMWEDEQDAGNSTLNYYEEWLQCCGKNSAEDYYLLDKKLPSSCCKDRDCTNVLNLYVVGCEQKFKEYLREKTSTFNTISWILISIEFVGSVFACILVDSIRNHRDRVRYYS